MTDGTVHDALAEPLRRTAERSRPVSVCTGALVLAAAGLLDARPATTHWVPAPAFADLFPQVTLDVPASAGNAAG